MSDRPINLNRARKDRARAEKRREADANAAKFGRTRAERDLDEARREKTEKSLDQHRREDT